jgi:hypothetical protein
MMKNDDDFRAVPRLLCREQIDAKLDFSIERNKMELALRFEAQSSKQDN